MQQLAAGNQYLDTSSFPVGAYQIQLRITDQFGQQHIQSQFFIKQPDRGLSGRFNYKVGIGFVQKANQNGVGVNIGSSDSSNLHKSFTHPIYTNIPIFTWDWVLKLTDKISLKNYLISDTKATYGTVSLDNYLGPLHISPGVIFSFSC